MGMKFVQLLIKTVWSKTFLRSDWTAIRCLPQQHLSWTMKTIADVPRGSFVTPQGQQDLRLSFVPKVVFIVTLIIRSVIIFFRKTLFEEMPVRFSFLSGAIGYIIPSPSKWTKSFTKLRDYLCLSVKLEAQVRHELCLLCLFYLKHSIQSARKLTAFT